MAETNPSNNRIMVLEHLHCERTMVMMVMMMMMMMVVMMMVIMMEIMMIKIMQTMIMIKIITLMLIMLRLTTASGFLRTSRWQRQAAGVKSVSEQRVCGRGAEYNGSKRRLSAERTTGNR
jgi:hypothetical protein